MIPGILRNFSFVAFAAGLFITGQAAHAAEYTTVSTEMKVEVELAFSPPQYYYDFDGKTLSWREPEAGNTHYMSITLRDLASSNPITAAAAHAVISTPKGKVVGTSITLHETWSEDKLHYGANIQIAEELTSGNVTVKLDPSKNRRLGRQAGDFFTKAVVAKFEDVDFRQELTKLAGDITTQPIAVEWPEGRRPYVEPTPYPGATR